jgi:hypothetical protein
MVGGQSAHANANLVAPLSHVVQIGNPVSQLDGMMKGQQMPQWAEFDAFGSLQGLSDQQVRGWARFPSRRQVLSNPGLFKTERVKALQLSQIPLLTVPDRPFRAMGRHKQRAEFHKCHPDNLREYCEGLQVISCQSLLFARKKLIKSLFQGLSSDLKEARR